MKTRPETRNSKLETANAEQPFGINYRWTAAGGVICTGHTVVLGRDRAHAERRFFQQHRHVEPEGAER